MQLRVVVDDTVPGGDAARQEGVHLRRHVPLDDRQEALLVAGRVRRVRGHLLAQGVAGVEEQQDEQADVPDDWSEGRVVREFEGIDEEAGAEHRHHEERQELAPPADDVPAVDAEREDDVVEHEQLDVHGVVHELLQVQLREVRVLHEIRVVLALRVHGQSEGSVREVHVRLRFQREADADLAAVAMGRLFLLVPPDHLARGGVHNVRCRRLERLVHARDPGAGAFLHPLLCHLHSVAGLQQRLGAVLLVLLLLLHNLVLEAHILMRLGPIGVRALQRFGEAELEPAVDRLVPRQLGDVDLHEAHRVCLAREVPVVHVQAEDRVGHHDRHLECLIPLRVVIVHLFHSLDVVLVLVHERHVVEVELHKGVGDVPELALDEADGAGKEVPGLHDLDLDLRVGLQHYGGALRRGQAHQLPVPCDARLAQEVRAQILHLCRRRLRRCVGCLAALLLDGLIPCRRALRHLGSKGRSGRPGPCPRCGRGVRG
mmetsp:Transcript_4283/g.12515  ORF Transcript_4283/g.12515 Transcript_4283/m.12515 type:complete len:486 (-) Transcript_4283:15-1472(-)